MFKSWKTLAAAALLSAGFGAAPALAQTDEQDLIAKARITVDHLRTDKEFGNARDLLHRARAVVIVPSLVKGGFFVGGEGGDAVLLARTGAASWSEPAFYSLASASFGLQIGLEQAEVVLLVMNDKAVQALMKDEFKIGAQAGVTVVTLGSGGEAGTTAAAGADIVVWSSATGAYAGLTLNGSIIKPRDSYNAAYYGKPVRPYGIVFGHGGHNPGDSGLLQALASIS